jgi:hypothetical protein
MIMMIDVIPYKLRMTKDLNHPWPKISLTDQVC